VRVKIELERLRGSILGNRLRKVRQNAFQIIGKREKERLKGEEELGCKFCNFSR